MHCGRNTRPVFLRNAAQAGTLFFLSRKGGALIGDVAQALRIGAPAMSGLALAQRAKAMLVALDRRQDWARPAVDKAPAAQVLAMPAGWPCSAAGVADARPTPLA